MHYCHRKVRHQRIISYEERESSESESEVEETASPPTPPPTLRSGQQVVTPSGSPGPSRPVLSPATARQDEHDASSGRAASAEVHELQQDVPHRGGSSGFNDGTFIRTELLLLENVNACTLLSKMVTFCFGNTIYQMGSY